jgi:hypothetical protein
MNNQATTLDGLRPAIFAIPDHRGISISTASQLTELGVSVQDQAECAICDTQRGLFFEIDNVTFCSKCVSKRL